MCAMARNENKNESARHTTLPTFIILKVHIVHSLFNIGVYNSMPIYSWRVTDDSVHVVV